MMIEELLKKYKDMAFDPNQPFAMEVYHLHRQYPNDKDFGENLRKLIVRMEKHLREASDKKNKEDLNRILKDGK